MTEAEYWCGITFVLLTEAHVTMPVSFSHAGMVDHEKVDLKVVCACSLDLVVLCTNELNHFHTASLTGLHGGHVIQGISPIPWIIAPFIFPSVAVKALNLIARHAVPASTSTKW